MSKGDSRKPIFVLEINSSLLYQLVPTDETGSRKAKLPKAGRIKDYSTTEKNKQNELNKIHYY